MAAAAVVQQSRIQDQLWRDADVSLVRGGMLQLQKSSAGTTTSIFTPLKKPPARLLATLQESSLILKHGLDPHIRDARMSSGSLKARPARNPEQPMRKDSKNLRERVACTEEMPEPLKAECLERLDIMTASRPPARRPSWTHDSTASRGKQRRGSLGASSCSSVCSSGSTEVANSRIGSKPTVPRDADLPRATSSSRNSRPGQPCMEQPRQSQRGLNGNTAQVDSPTSTGVKPAATNAAGIIWTFTPSCPPSYSRMETSATKQHEQHEPLRQKAVAVPSSFSVLVIPPLPAPEGQVAEVTEAVAAARYMLRSMSEDDDSVAAPMRGASSLLRTSLRLAIQA